MGAIRRWLPPGYGESVAVVMKQAPKADPASRGKWAESVAEDFLRGKGLESLQANYRCPHGELDLVMRDGSTLVFVEVRYRQSVNYGSGADSVTGSKQQRMIASAQHYLQHTNASGELPCRFDVVAISKKPDKPEIDWIKDAFDA